MIRARRLTVAVLVDAGADAAELAEWLALECRALCLALGDAGFPVRAVYLENDGPEADRC